MKDCLQTYGERYIQSGDLELIQNAYNTKSIIHAVSKLRDVYSSVKMDKVSKLVNQSNANVLTQLKTILYSDALGSNVQLDEAKSTLLFRDNELQNSHTQ